MKRKRYQPGFGDSNFISSSDRRARYNQYNRSNSTGNQTDGERRFPSQNRPYSDSRQPYRSRDSGSGYGNYSQRSYPRDQFKDRSDFRNRTYDSNSGERRQYGGNSTQNYSETSRYSRGSSNYGGGPSRFGDYPPRNRDQTHRPWVSRFGNYPQFDSRAFPGSDYRRNYNAYQRRTNADDPNAQQQQGSIFVDKNDQMIRSEAPDFGNQNEFEKQPDFIEEEVIEPGRYITEEEDRELRRIEEYNDEIEKSSYQFVDAEEKLGFKIPEDVFNEEEDVIFDPLKLSK
jgi:hypothetical protein